MSKFSFLVLVYHKGQEVAQETVKAVTYLHAYQLACKYVAPKVARFVVNEVDVSRVSFDVIAPWDL